ncbi:GAF domain-containing sensor histidine kinase [Planosporangium thailandense]|uniref:GAF domain-containing sensor histidine kinase n=1 Tax=Planosporangium thailandense TaxID=765197 RepID=A0ABX0XWU1_9ACTN|nr:GAF domain-containing sensor histidine kinase [Planosporangium thailandense]NJC70500.1 GAF domain-containing sensor histidine kinase [Planosporangium thailandense]
MTAQRRARQADRTAQLDRAVAELTADIRRGRDSAEVLDRVCAYARLLTGAAAAAAMTAEPDGGGGLVVRAVAGPVGTWLRGVRVPAGDTVAGTVLRDGGPLTGGALSAPLRRPPHVHEQALAAAGLRRVVYTPITGYGSVAGVLGVAYRYGGSVAAHRLRRLAALAAVAGLVAPGPARGDPGGFATVTTLDGSGSRARFQTMVERVVELTGATDCGVYLPDGRSLTPVALARGPGRTAGGNAAPTGAGAGAGGRAETATGAGAGGRAETATGAGALDPALVARLLAEQRPGTLWRLAGGRLLCLPLPAHGAVLGALCVRWPDGTQPDPAERMLVNLTAGEAAGLVDRERRRALEEEQVATREREWLARELHDSVIQTLYGISLGAGAAGALLRDDTTQAEQSVAWIHETAVAGLTEMHGLIQRLRPDALADDGLTAALGRLLETLHTLHGCRTSAELGPEPPVGAEVRQALYRIAQEAIANAAKHARAGLVTLRLYTRDPYVVLEVVDDGQGFTPGGDLRGRMGLRSMRDRAGAVGGRLDIITAPGRGTVIRAEVPAGGDAAPARLTGTTRDPRRPG